MNHDYKPAGYTSVAPYLLVNGAEATMCFLEQVFGATRLFEHPGEAGTVMHAELRIDDTVLMLADGGAGAVAAHIHIYVPDVDATFARALAAGAVPVQAPVRKQDQDKRGGFRDAGGTTWWVGTRQPD
ncbi:VOC family protein [Chitinibacteraceae bacterium HSL-7]